METSRLTKGRILTYLNEGKRFDGRELGEYREIVIETGISNKAEGSARVKLGNTEVIAGVKMDVVTPFPDGPDEGVLIMSSELLPLSAAKYEPGPPKIDAIEMARIVDRGIRESHFIDFKKLCIKEKEKVWAVYIDLYSINDDGNLLDAFALAALVALKNAKIPKYDGEVEKVIYDEHTSNHLPLTKSMPFTITVHKVGNNFLIDTSADEEEASEARVTFSISEGPMINAIQKGEDKELTINEMFEVIDFVEKRWKDLYPKINKMIEDKAKQ